MSQINHWLSLEIDQTKIDNYIKGFGHVHAPYNEQEKAVHSCTIS